jgi:hypothetical protein
MINDSGSTIPVLTPVAVDADGRLQLVDVANDDASISLAGLTFEDILDGQSGRVTLTGKIENITTPFAPGEYLYVSKSGGLTNLIPQIGFGGFVSGDSIIRVGVIVRNADIPSNKDLLVKMQLVGKL